MRADASLAVSPDARHVYVANTGDVTLTNLSVTDPLGFTYPPYAYAAGQILARAVSETKSLDDEKLADYIRKNTVDTIIGPMTFGDDGEWKTPRIIYAQFRNVAGNDIGQFRDMSRQFVVWPPELKTGDLVYPYDQAVK